MRIWLHACAVLLMLTIGSAGSQDPHLSHGQATRDVRTLLDLLEATHPDPYMRLGGKVAFKRQAQQLIASIPQSGLSRAELGDRLRAFLSRLEDGHTYVTGATDKWRDPEPRLPVEFGIAADGLFVSGFHVPELRGTAGWRVLAANGVSIEELTTRYDAVPHENIYGGYHLAASFLRSFKFMNNLVGGPRSEDAITFTLESPEGRREQRAVPWSARGSVPAAKWLQPSVRWSAWQHSEEMYWSRVLDRPAAGYLRVGSLMGREAFELAHRMNPESAMRDAERLFRRRGLQPPADFSTVLSAVPSLFETTADLLGTMKSRGVRTLIVDLRDNDGGWTQSAHPMVHALYGDAFYGTDTVREYVTVESPLFLRKLNTTAEQRRQQEPEFELGRYVFKKAEPVASARQRRLERLAEYKAAGYTFAGALEALGGNPVYRPQGVVVLCNQGTFSAAFHLMMWLRHMGATIVGIPSRQSPNAFNDVTEFTLPESGLTGSISNSVQLMLPDQPAAAVLEPHFPVTVDIFRRFGSDRETPLRYALELVESGKIPER